MKLPGKIELIDLAIYAHNTLIISDIHIGYEEALNKQGVFVPRFQFKEILKRFDSIFGKLKDKKIEAIVVAGDLKHEFGSISDQEWRHTLQLLDYFSKKAEKIILLRGNHDTILRPIASKRNVIVADFLSLSKAGHHAYHKGDLLEKIPVGKKTVLNESKDKLITSSKPKDTLFKKIKNKLSKSRNERNSILIGHGDIVAPKELLKGTKILIIGHEHPAVSIRDGPRKETFKCFLVGKWKDLELIVLPSFNLVNEGTDVSKEKLLSPYLKQDIGDFRVIVVADKMYDFGKLKDI